MILVRTCNTTLSDSYCQIFSVVYIDVYYIKMFLNESCFNNRLGVYCSMVCSVVQCIENCIYLEDSLPLG